MEIILAKNAGFCFGVEKAVNEVYNRTGAVTKPDPSADSPAGEDMPPHGVSAASRVYTFGEIVHNEAVISDLAEKGVRVIDSDEALDRAGAENAAKKTGESADCIIIRAHGVGEAVQKKLDQSGLHVIDATCPFVKRIHRIVREAGEKGHAVVIAGNPAHPEVQGIVGWATGDVFVVETKGDATSLQIPRDRVITIVSQTTGNLQKFEEIVEIFIKKGYNVSVANTICNATSVRQEEARQIAASVDVMIVAGGANSSNTHKLYEISAANCANTYLVRQAGDLKGVRLKDAAKVGITAGASTPKTIIEEVLQYVRTGSIV